MNAIDIDVIRDRLRRAGWSLGETACGPTWLVDGTNGENVILARAGTQLGAWRLAMAQAAAVGMVAGGRNVHDRQTGFRRPERG
jgi:hypothetical protein